MNFFILMICILLRLGVNVTKDTVMYDLYPTQTRSNVTKDTVVYKSKPLTFLSFPLPVFDGRSSGAALGDEEQYVASCYHKPHCQQAQESWRQEIQEVN